MKRQFKLFPMALAMIALASCSNDDLLDVNGSAQKDSFNSKNLYTVFETPGDITRGGFITSTLPDAGYLMGRSSIFTEGDKIKVYHNTANWRPQEWEFTGEMVQYKGSEGVLAAEWENQTSDFDQYEDAYAVYPHNLGQFTNELREEIEFDLTQYKKIVYDRDSSENVKLVFNDAEYEKSATYSIDVPMWGRKSGTDDVMKLDVLTGILRVDISNMPVVAEGKAKYLVILSDKMLAGKFKTSVDPDKLMEKGGSPELEIDPAATTDGAVATSFPLATLANNAIVVEIPEGMKGNTILWAPIPAGEHGTLEVYLTKDLENVEVEDHYDLTDAANATKIGELTGEDIAKQNGVETRKDVVRSRTYTINYDAFNKNTTAATPFEFARDLIAADKNAYRDFEITFTRPIVVKNDDTAPQNKWIDLTGTEPRYGLTEADGWDLKHNVTVNVTFTGGGNSAKRVLYIRTKESSKTLTLNIKNAIADGGTAIIDTIVIEKDSDLGNKLVLRSQEANGSAFNPLPNIRNASNKKLTIVSPVHTLETSGELDIDIEFFGGTWLGTSSANKVSNLVLTKGVEKVNVKNGYIQNILLSSTAAKKLDADVEIHTEGLSLIGTVDLTNMPVKTEDGKYSDDAALKFTSKWDGTSKVSGTHATATVFKMGATNISTNCIATAAALAGWAQDATITANVNLVGEFDLNSKTWTSKANVENNVIGQNYFKRVNVNAITVNPAPQGNAVIKNLVGTNGLIAEVTMDTADETVKNITFDGTNTITVNNTDNVGLLVGKVDGTAATVIQNIEVMGTNTITGNGTSQNIAAVIGQQNASELKLANIKVGGTTKVEGYFNVGGIIGEVANKVQFLPSDGTNIKTTYAADNKYCVVNVDANENLKTHMTSTSTEFSENMAKHGLLIGSIKNNEDATYEVSIYSDDVLNKVDRTAQKEKWLEVRDNYEMYPHTIHRYYDEIGLSGVVGKAVTTSFPLNTPEVDGTTTVPTVKVYYPKTASGVTTYGNTQILKASVGGTAAPTDDATNGIYYMNWVEN